MKEKKSSTDSTLFEYGGAKQRVLKTGVSTGSTLYIHGLSGYPLLEKTSSGTERMYVYGPTGLIALRQDSIWYYVMKDHLGSVRLVMSIAGVAQATYDYDSYGKLVRNYKAGTGSPYEFTGQEFDMETGLYNFRARHYDTDLGMFCAADPAGSSTSPYGYAMNNPISFVDPTGMIAQGEGGAAGIPRPFYTYHPICDDAVYSILDLSELGFPPEEININPENWDYTGAINPAGNILETGLSPSSSSGNPMMSYGGQYIAAQYAINPTVMSCPTIPNLSSNWSFNAGPQGYYIAPMADYGSVNRHGGGGGYNFSIIPTVQNGGIVQHIGNVLDAVTGTIVGVSSMRVGKIGNNGWVMGNGNGQKIWYPLTKGGNQFKLGQNAALKSVSNLNTIGQWLSYASMAYSIWEFNDALQTDNLWYKIAAGADLFGSTAGAFGGSTGVAYSAGYNFGKYVVVPIIGGYWPHR